MNVEVDMELCCSTGQCVVAAPRVFRFEADVLVWDKEPPEDERTDVVEAVDLCPMQAITLAG